MRKNARFLREGCAGGNAPTTDTVVNTLTVVVYIPSVGNHSATNAITLGKPHARAVLWLVCVFASADTCLAITVRRAMSVEAADTSVLVWCSVASTVKVCWASRVGKVRVHLCVRRTHHRPNGRVGYGWCKTIRATSLAVEFGGKKRWEAVGMCYGVNNFASSLAIGVFTLMSGFRAARV
jgi:hypothetical protein